MLRQAGYSASAPVALEGGKLVVKIWLGQRRGTPAAANKEATA